MLPGGQLARDRQDAGYARVPGGGWRQHGEPKTVLVRELRSGACAALRQGEDEEEWGLAARRPRPPATERLESLYEFLRRVPEYRKARGIRHQLATILSIALAAKLCGVRGVVAIGEFASHLTQAQLSAVRAFWNPSKERYVAPSTATFHRVLSELPPEVLDRALQQFIDRRRAPLGAVALDGKATAAEWTRGKDSERMLVAAVEHASGLVCGQEACDGAGGEIVGVRELLCVGSTSKTAW